MKHESEPYRLVDYIRDTFEAELAAAVREAGWPAEYGKWGRITVSKCWPADIKVGFHQTARAQDKPDLVRILKSLNHDT